MTTANLLPDLKVMEGFRPVAYKDTRGIWTIGYGHAHVSEGDTTTIEQATVQLQADVDSVINQLNRNLPWFKDLDDIRQDVIVNMTFNMGWETLSAFHTFLRLMYNKNYDLAATDLESTAWYKEVGHRAVVLCKQLGTGEHVAY